MANLLNKLVYVKKNASFTAELKETYKHSIVFVEDEGVLWTHGKAFGLSATDLAALKGRVETLEGLRWFNGIAEIGENKGVFKAGENATTIKFGGDKIITVTVDADGVHFAAKEVTAEGDSYVGATASTDGSNKVTIATNVTKMAEITEENSGEGTLVDAADVKDYIDTEVGKVQADLDGEVMEAGYVADVMVGGLNKGTNIAGKSAVEVLDMILKPEYAPTFEDASVAIACSDTVTLKEVGSKTPAESAYSATGSTASTTAGSYVAHGGEGTDVFTISSKTADGSDYDTVTTKPGSFSVKVTRTYAEGTEVVKSNKGNATNKIAANATTLLENASANSNIDAESKTIKQITKTATHTINYAYQIYASTSSAGQLTSLGLLTSVSGKEATLKGGSAGQMFAVPASYTGIKIEEYNDTLKSWTDTTSGWNTSATEFALPDGTKKAYTVYTRANNSGENMKARISATVA